MFTGLVAAKGTLVALTAAQPSTERAADAGARLMIRHGLDDGPLAMGESIAVDGVCLSVDGIGADSFEVDASAETLARTTLGRLAAGAEVHLERSLRVGDRLGGHLVTGHVDGVGALVERRPLGDSVWMSFRLPAELARYVAQKGSVAIDGVSLTVNNAQGDRFDVVIIPHTLIKTKLGELYPGAPVNVEVDPIARYVARLMGDSGSIGTTE